MIRDKYFEGHSSEEEARYYLEMNGYDVPSALENLRNYLKFEASVYEKQRGVVKERKG